MSSGVVCIAAAREFWLLPERESFTVFCMSDTIQWPDGEFTIQAAVELNSAQPETLVRKKLAEATAAKKIVQTQKGDKKIKGKFKAVK